MDDTKVTTPPVRICTTIRGEFASFGFGARRSAGAARFGGQHRASSSVSGSGVV
jgi:hypothetical protein